MRNMFVSPVPANQFVGNRLTFRGITDIAFWGMYASVCGNRFCGNRLIGLWEATRASPTRILRQAVKLDKDVGAPGRANVLVQLNYIIVSASFPIPGNNSVGAVFVCASELGNCVATSGAKFAIQ